MPYYSFTMSFQALVRPNILKLVPYRCARDDFSEGVLLDANENTSGPAIHDLKNSEVILELNRYPDPHQLKLKSLIAKFRGHGLTHENLYLGVGSDEAIDSIIRVFCKPGIDKLATCVPTYGMYRVSADINDVKVVSIPLDLETFELQPQVTIKSLNADPSIKLLYLCSPGNPTGKRLNPEYVELVINNWNGIVVVDEAYIDFTDGAPSMAPLVNQYDRLIVLQTLSKSFGLAGVRLGLAYACKELASIMNALKAPYNISVLTADTGIRALSDESIAIMRTYISEIQRERKRLLEALSNIKGIGRNRGGCDANFVLVEILDAATNKPSNDRAHEVYNTLATERKVVVRFRGNELGCEGCLRMSIGTKRENDILIRELTDILG